MALDNARLYAERDRIAMVLQRGLRPDEPQPIPGLELSVVFEAAGEGVELGGDFYDVIPVGDTHYVLVGDVAGHGAEVAAYTAQIRHTVRALARFGTDPPGIVERVNTVLLETDTGERFATLQLARIETRESGAIDVELASAAHPPAVLVRGEGATETLSGGAIVGVWQQMDVAVHRFTVEPTETLLLYTDGWLEAGPVDAHRTPEELATELAAIADDDLGSVLERLRADAVARGEPSSATTSCCWACVQPVPGSPPRPEHHACGQRPNGTWRRRCCQNSGPWRCRRCLAYIAGLAGTTRTPS